MWQTIGQEQVVRLLQTSIAEGHLSHAYLFIGPHHVGKMTLAQDLAQAINCEAEERPCTQCVSCRRIAAGKHADVQVIGLLPEERTEIGMDQIREVCTMASLPPYEGKYKVFIIDRAEHLSTEASNSLLKTLEEPPPQVLLILLTTREGALPATIVSRCQKIVLHPLSFEGALEVLRHKVESSQAELLARLSGGCLGWALAAIQDEGQLGKRAEWLDQLSALEGASLQERLSCAAELAADFSKNREKVREVLAIWLGWWRDLLLVKGGSGEYITNCDRESILRDQAQGYALRQIKEFIVHLQEAAEQLELNANPRLVLEVVMLNMPQRRSTSSRQPAIC
jgi:DNA polymerase-3 subunit delta'